MEKAKSVMLRVGKMLNPTKNNNMEETKEEIPVEAVSNNDNYEEEELNLPKFDDLPTVSSLTKDGSIKNENNSQEPVTVNSNVSTFSTVLVFCIFFKLLSSVLTSTFSSSISVVTSSSSIFFNFSFIFSITEESVCFM